MKRYRYPGIQPFTTAQEDIFFGREKDIEKLKMLIELQKLVVLYSKSGIGKSSMINAGLIPLLNREGFIAPTTIRFRGWDNQSVQHNKTPKRTFLDQIDGLRSNSSYLDKLIPKEFSLWYHFKTRGHKNNNVDLLIFDQFEELFTYPPEEVLQFARELKELLADEIPERWKKALEQQYEAGKPVLSDDETEKLYKPLSIKLLFVVRDDQLGALLGIQPQFPNVLRYIYHLEPLDKDQVTAAIVRPALLPSDLFISSPFEYSKEAVEKIWNDLTIEGNYQVTSFQWQIVCQDLEGKIIRSGKTRVEVEDVQGIFEIFQKFYHAQLNQLRESDRKAAQKLLEEGLVFEQEERRLSLQEEAIFERFNVSRNTLDQLVSSGLLRRDHTDNGEFTYELSHDTLVRPVLSAKSDRLAEEQLAEERLEKEVQIQAFEEEKRKRRRLTWFTLAVILVAFVAMALGFYSYQQYQRAERQKLKSEKSTRTANNVALAFSESDKILAARIAEYAYLNDPDNPAAKEAYLRLTHDSTLISYLARMPFQASGMSFSKDGEKLIVADIQGRIFRVDGRTWKSDLLHTGAFTLSFGGQTVFSPDNTFCMTVSPIPSGKVEYFNLQSGERQDIELEFPGHYLQKIDFSPINDRILLADKDEGTFIVDMEGKVIQKHENETGFTLSCQFSSDGQYYLNVRLKEDSKEENFFVHNRDGNLLDQFLFRNVYSAAFTADNNLLLVGFKNGRVGIYELDTGDKVNEFFAGQKGIFIYPADYGTKFATIDDPENSQVIRVWNWDGELISQLEGHSYLVTDVLFFPFDYGIVSTSMDKTVKIWGLNAQGGSGIVNEETKKRLQGPALNVSAKGDSVFFVRNDSTKRVLYAKEAGRYMHDFDLSMKAAKVVITNDDGTFVILDTLGNMEQTIGEGNDFNPFDGVAFSPDETMIVTGNVRGLAQFWDLNGKALKSISVSEARSQGIGEVALSNDNKLLAVSTSIPSKKSPNMLLATRVDAEEVVFLLNEKGETLLKLFGHFSPIYHMEFSPDNAFLLTHDRAGIAKIWSLEKGHLMTTLPGRYKRLNIDPKVNHMIVGETISGDTIIVPVLPLFLYPLNILRANNVKLEPEDLKKVEVREINN